MVPLNASDCISPAFQHTKRQLFQPFRLPFWARLALLGFLTGELGGSGCNFNFNGGGRSGSSGGDVPWHWPHTAAQIAAIVAAAVVVGIVVILILTYLNSVLRFVLFESILTGDTRIREGWRKWRASGRKYFVWQILLGALSFGMAILLIGVPMLLLFTRGMFRSPHFDPRILLYLVPGVLAFVLYAIAIAVVTVLAKDFMVPMMALEGIGWREGWSRVWRIVKAEPGDYVLYILLKIALRIATGIVYAIAFVIIMLIIAIPVVILVIAGVAAATGATLAVKALLITIGIVLGCILFVFLMALAAFLGSPLTYFFPSYSVFFFGSRYEPLRRIVYPAQPPILTSWSPEAPPALG